MPKSEIKKDFRQALKQLDLIEVKYFQTRIKVTLIVCISLALIKISF